MQRPTHSHPLASAALARPFTMASPLQPQSAAGGPGPANSAQRVLVRHAGGTIKLPLLPADSVKSLRSQLVALGLRPCELDSFAHCTQLRDELTMAQADVLDCRSHVFMAKAPLAAAGAAAAAASNGGAGGAAGGAAHDWSLWVYERRPIAIQVSDTLK